jgi:hypothetical protein
MELVILTRGVAGGGGSRAAAPGSKMGGKINRFSEHN